jgi:hypothetical protein
MAKGPSGAGLQGNKLSGPAHASAVEGLMGIAPGSLGGGAGMAAGPAWSPADIKAGGRWELPKAPPGAAQGIAKNWVTYQPPQRQALATLMAPRARQYGGGGNRGQDAGRGGQTSGGRGGFGGSSARSGGLY